ncbi:MAG: carboxypeptidase regulatory-like domain-containing protein [Vicinamibacterales bacterium]
MRRLIFGLLAALWLVGSSTPLFAQGFQGGIRGAVKDSGGVIPGVEVTLTNEATSVLRSTTTNEAGEYNFPNLAPGTYTLKATLQGYKTYQRAGLTVGTQQFLTLDATLEVGSLDETITVTGAAPLIETSNASTGTRLDAEALQTLPAAGRNAFMIGSTVPTVIASGDTQYNRQQDQTNSSLVSLGGGTRRGNNYVLDGVPVTDLRNRASANPTIEALDDVKVQVHTYDAEMGRTGGGVFNTTLRSGTNNWRGSGFIQNRPIWGQTNNYFSELAGVAKPQSPYWLGGGGVGGPIKKNRTFFWFASENYSDTQTRNASELMPTALERAGDFSKTTNAAGQPVVIYDPLTRQPFPGNVIPAGRINPVAAAMLKYLPAADVQVDNGSANYTRTSLIKTVGTQQYTGKVEHKFTDAISLTGFYLWNRSDEPCANYFSTGSGFADQTDPNRFADPGDYLLKRRPWVLALNNTWVLNNTTVLSLRYGQTSFPDNDVLTVPFDPSTLGFSQTYLNQIAVQKFPSVRIRGYDSFASQTLGAINPTDRDWYSTSANGTLSKIIGTHTLKFGGDYRKIGLDFYAPGNGAGFFDFEKDITSSTGLNANSTTDGNAFASFLLGLPSALSNRQSSITLSTPVNIYKYYYGGYAQDDWRINAKLTVNYGIRLEHETGMAEKNNNFTVGFDRTATNGLSNVVLPADPLAGVGARSVTGGLMYAGVNGNPTTQGNPPRLKWSPRVGLAYSVDSKTVIRGGYGVYWAPYNYPAPSSSANNYGQVGYTQNTFLVQSASNPTTTLTNPFPNGLIPVSGSTNGLLSGVGSTISFVDQTSTAPRVQQYSVDIQRELGGNQSLTLSYIGSKGSNLSLGGSIDAAVNINQLDPKYMALGSALNESLPNPFFGNPSAGALSTQATLTRRQLLRPFPQFLDINARHVLEGKSQYDAVVLEYSKRATGIFGGRVSYTWSRLMDNQMAETNFYTAGGYNPMNNYNYLSYMPACTTTTFAACYDPNADWARSLLDVPHRVILAPVVNLPFKSSNALTNGIIGGWVISAAVNLQAGFPIAVQQSDNTGTFSAVQRPNLVPGVDLATAGSYEDRLASADHPTATYVNPAAFTTAPNFTYGNAPRTITDIRTPGTYNVDASFIKNVRFGTKSLQFKLEALNMLNRVQVRTLQGRNTVGTANFGQTTTQAGFMRIIQLMARFSF